MRPDKFKFLPTWRQKSTKGSRLTRGFRRRRRLSARRNGRAPRVVPPRASRVVPPRARRVAARRDPRARRLLIARWPHVVPAARLPPDMSRS